MIPHTARDLTFQLQDDLDAYLAVAGARDNSPAVQTANALLIELEEVRRIGDVIGECRVSFTGLSM